MRHPHSKTSRTARALRTTTVGAVSATLVAGTALGLAPAAQAASADAPTTRFVDIEGHGGTVLKANVVAPADASRAYPLLVLPTSWGLPQVEYLARAQKLADAGYVVVSYNVRGFWESGGHIEVAGPPDIADASKVIDWALANTPADAGHVGMAGLSYGAGISLLTAAHDKRVKAVAALSGWADLIDSIYSGRTQHIQATGLLDGAGRITGRQSPELQQIFQDFYASNLEKEPELIAWGKKRSPASHVDRINANGTAVMLANGWGDSIFPPNQYADFYEKLSGPKRLELRPGDHATTELTGLFGLPNDVWTDTRRWFDHYLKGVANGIDREQPVRLKSRTGGGFEGYPDWKSVTATRKKIALTSGTTIHTNVDSGANGGIIFLSGVLDQVAQLPPVASIPLLPRRYAAVWQSEKYRTTQAVRGTAALHTTVTATKESGTLVAYLYDVGPLGLGKLVSNAPYTFHGKTPGQPFGVDLELFSTAYDVPAGHRLALVVDTVDPLYIEHNPSGAQLTFSSPPNDPSYVSIPLREQ
ncbi:CocE/NonD family hydrolase [Streptomyces ipomoeae]|uniref:Hydrolase CocE/NonD family protein n=1 Tax=Streptomyces ipomoeae 91-03 TaxID=698759 RepID=L1L9M1_9ACTN|nr:alpha/beta fold hydrolase [Streptomyces ipomoeae]EKX69395.1 hydrolase CocE/NonD family protein [Streptomyces ipomoeae 91-03]MDX2697480.1 CocE/NonD family hydrolase [Streptomyces ipomoeae]MDX2825346.1 CocE/NonD family hydrolase [Streptomyces ipomoeae]MDX2843237.1 CocE/NonD family hydrolase [Streptomyces ipomoeae]MDX2877927.1 CocE/NonD family hydrolase [Streptomyces ipomoeae]